VELRLDDVAENAGIARPDENRLGAEPAQRRVQGTTIEAEAAVSPYGPDVNFVIYSPRPQWTKVATPSDWKYPGEKAHGHWRIR